MLVEFYREASSEAEETLSITHCPQEASKKTPKCIASVRHHINMDK